MASAQSIKGGKMPAKRRFRFLSSQLHAGHRAALLGVATVIALAVGASAALADAGSVYVDGNGNVGAGHDFFGGTTPAGFDNVGMDYSVMPHLTTGNDNVATGFDVLLDNTSGNDNAAFGVGALESNTSGGDNIGAGFLALSHNTTGSANIALGSGSGANLTTGSDNIDIANKGAAGESGVIRIGTLNKQTAAFLRGVYGKSVGATSKAVVVNPNGKLGTAPAPAAPLKSQSKTLGRLRDKVHQQNAELRHQGAAIQRLRQQMQNGG
jgi:hypothetical protein